MSRRLEFRPEASADVAEAFSYYEAQGTGLGVAFINELQRATDFVEAFPDACPVVHASFRRALVQRFPYAVYYRSDSDLIDVKAVLSTHRDPRLVQRRV